MRTVVGLVGEEVGDVVDAARFLAGADGERLEVLADLVEFFGIKAHADREADHGNSSILRKKLNTDLHRFERRSKAILCL
jgi:hypothetical protein